MGKVTLKSSVYNSLSMYYVGPPGYRAIEYPPVTFDQLVDSVGINKDLLDKECSDEHLREIAAHIKQLVEVRRGSGIISTANNRN